MASVNKEVFTVKVDDQDVKLAVKRPNYKQEQDATKVKNKAFREAVESGALLRDRALAEMVKQKLWDEEKDQEFKRLSESIMAGEKKLAAGGLKLWSDARDIAVRMRIDRNALQNLLLNRNKLDENTAEAQADNARFNYLVSVCTVYNETGKAFFKNVDDYMERGSEAVAQKSAETLANLLYGLSQDYYEKLPENKFLKKFKMADEKLRLVNKDGKLCNAQGKLVNEDGLLINEKGELIDSTGTRLSVDGDYIVEDAKPFLDEDGKVIADA